MSIFRLTAVAVSLTLFSACGGGGGGGAAGGGGGGGGGGGIVPESLPPFLVERVGAMQSVDGDIPQDMTSEQIEEEFVSRAAAADRLIGDIFDVSTERIPIRTSCSGKTCSATIEGDPPSIVTFSPERLGGVPEVAGMAMGFNEQYQAVMTDRNVMLMQLRNAGRTPGNGVFQFQSYGGWLNHSVFAFQAETLTSPEGTGILLTSYSFGNESGTNPQGAAGSSFMWTGVMVGTSTSAGTRHVIHGDATVEYSVDSPRLLDSIVFNDVWNLDGGTPVIFGDDGSSLEFMNVPLNNGSFVSTEGDIEGAFYGNNHEEVGGIFHTDTYIGAFGASQ